MYIFLCICIYIYTQFCFGNPWKKHWCPVKVRCRSFHQHLFAKLVMNGSWCPSAEGSNEESTTKCQSRGQDTPEDYTRHIVYQAPMHSSISSPKSCKIFLTAFRASEWEMLVKRYPKSSYRIYMNKIEQMAKEVDRLPCLWTIVAQL